MHGHAPVTPPRRPGPSAGVIAVRVIICALMVLTCGFLAWIGMLRIAIMRRGGRDWALFWAQLVLNVACLATLEQRLADHWISNVGMAGLLLQMAAVTAYYLVVDIRHHRPSPAFPPYGQGHAPYGYGYPASAMAVPQPAPLPQSTPLPQPPPVPPQAAPRIEQVRAELDELSDLLRKDPKNPREGGR
ncbi:hypothetical protein GPZ77_13805 [Streptomyces sp. QHH-9511]|uniref:hypothetical protein n=1 Tax=Streptomyces sp. QHH-9511 TaxID=2684468 RepID=UPI00131719E6|nr:hypothetical protein [Streptomyces sp. QHH-9511]QGZ49307.1 hypothetical protein GPZ77_13805 [Streptomyces sp. QHH-9511]